MYGMKDRYITGIRLIDDAHTRLFELIDEADDLLKQDDKREDIWDRLTDLAEEIKDCADKHFMEEEEYLDGIGYKKIFTQIIEHNECRRKLEEFSLSDVDEGREEKAEAMLAYLIGWLDSHITDVDIMIYEKAF